MPPDQRERFSTNEMQRVTLQNATAWDHLDRLELAVVSHELVHAVNDIVKRIP